MKSDCDKLLKQLPDYLKGNLSAEEHAAFEARLAASGCKDEFDALRDVWLRLAAAPEVEPGPAVSARFYAMLDAYKAGVEHASQEVRITDVVNRWLERRWPRQPVFQMAIAICLLLLGLFAGSRFSAEGVQSTHDLRSEVMDLRLLVATSLLQSQSPSERLRGVSFSHELERPDERVLQTLLNTLNYDRNLNVRLATVDALSGYYDREMIRGGLLESLANQNSPLLQIALIDLLVTKEEQGSVALIRAIHENDSVQQAVRAYAGRAIERLE